MISSITNQGKVRFMLYRETMTGPVLIKFMSRLIKDAEQKFFIGRPMRRNITRTNT